MSYRWLPRTKLITALGIGGIVVSVGVCSVMMTPSAMAAGVVTEGDHESTAKNHRPKCEGDELPVDFSVRIYNIKLNVASTDNRAYVDYDTETIWKRCADNGTLRQNTRAYAVYGSKYCQHSGWYGTAVNGVHKNAYDCVKYIGASPDTYKGGSALACESPPSPYGTSNADCLTKPYGEEIAKKDNQPDTIAKTTISNIKGSVDNDGDGVGDGLYVPNWQNAKKNSGSKPFWLGGMCQYFKFGDGFDKTTNDRLSWRRCFNAKITVRWNVEQDSDPFVPIIDIDKDVVEPTDDDEYEVNGKIKYQPFETIDGQPKPQVPVMLHKAIYEPGQAPFGGGSNTDGPNSVYYRNPKELTLRDSVVDLTGNYKINPPIVEAFDPAYREKNGSIICYILAVQQPPTVETHTWTVRHSHWVQVGIDPEGVPIYDWVYTYTDHSHKYYSDKGHIHPNNGDDPWSGGEVKDPIPRVWVHAVDCVVVGKRPKVQILGSDLRVRGKTETKVSRYGSLYFGSWVEYAALTVGTDSAPASGGGYREGTPVHPNARAAWSKLTFANTPDYGGYTTLPSAPILANYYKERSEVGATPLSNGSITGKSGIFRTGNVTISGANIDTSVIIFSTGTVTIDGPITYRDGPYTSIKDIPQVIIVAENINILKSVNQVDAWLIAYDESADKSQGNIDTCSDGPAPHQRNSDDCNIQLVVNGLVVADGLYLNRTGPTEFNAAAAAEIFRLRPDAYMWASSRQQSTGAVRTVDIVELPPRF